MNIFKANVGDMMAAVQDYPRITRFLWFESNAEPAVNFYLSVFKNSRKLGGMRSSGDTPSGPKGLVLTISFALDGQKFTALNGGRYCKFNDTVSFVVRGDRQEEIDCYYSKPREAATKVAADG